MSSTKDKEIQKLEEELKGLTEYSDKLFNALAAALKEKQELQEELDRYSDLFDYIEHYFNKTGIKIDH